MQPFVPEIEWEREVQCYCKERIVTTRRHPVFDKYVVCSRECWDMMVKDGNEEPGSLLRNAK